MRVISSHFPRHIIASLRQVDVSSLTPLPVELGCRIGGKKPFAQGWTHTDRRLRRFFQKTVAGVVVVSFLDIKPMWNAVCNVWVCSCKSN